MKSLFIVIDGIDGCGSTTHVKLLEKWFFELRLKVKTTHEPTDSHIGKLIRIYLKSNISFPELDSLLFAADRINHSKQIESDLNNNLFIISDRYFESSISYQHSDGVDMQWIKELNKFALKPDIYIILDVDPRIAIERITKERTELEKFEKIDFLEKVRSVFLDRASQMNYPILNSSESIELVHKKVKKIVKPYLKSYIKDL